MKKEGLLPIFLFSGILMLIAWTGLGLVILYLPPTIGPRWLFFFLLFLAVSSMTVPVFYLINQRLERDRQIGFFPTIRESLELAFYVNLLVWLQFGRVLDVVTAILILAVIAAIEILIRIFERSRFIPTAQERESHEE